MPRWVRLLAFHFNTTDAEGYTTISAKISTLIAKCTMGLVNCGKSVTLPPRILTVMPLNGI